MNGEAVGWGMFVALMSGHILFPVVMVSAIVACKVRTYSMVIIYVFLISLLPAAYFAAKMGTKYRGDVDLLLGYWLTILILSLATSSFIYLIKYLTDSSNKKKET